MSSRSRYENRAKLITKAVRKDDTLPPALTREEGWANVRTKTDVVNFYQLYYPHLPDVLCVALADMYSRAVDGQIDLPEKYLQKKNPPKNWDYE